MHLSRHGAMLTHRCRWSKVKKANGLHPNDAAARVIRAAKEIGLGHARLQQLEEQGLKFEIKDTLTKFKVRECLRYGKSRAF